MHNQSVILMGEWVFFKVGSLAYEWWIDNDNYNYPLHCKKRSSCIFIYF